MALIYTQNLANKALKLLARALDTQEVFSSNTDGLMFTALYSFYQFDKLL